MSFNRETLVIALVVCVTAGALTVGSVPVAAQQELPASYYGEVTVNGEPADSDVVIEAEIDGEVRGTITVDESGQYGGPGAFDGKLDVSGSASDAGSEVTFYVNGDNFERTQATTHPGTVTWESGSVEAVDLSVDVEINDSGNDTSPNDGSGDDGTDDDDDTAGGDGSGGTPTQPSDDTPSEVIEDPEQISEETGVPEDANPIRAETANVTVDEETDQAQVRFSEESTVESITFSADTEGSVTVVDTESTPEETGDAPGAAVSVTQITVPENARDKSATIRKRVSTDRLEAVEAEPDDLRVNRYNEEAGEWQSLETQVVNQSGGGVVLEAETPGFSYFAVSAVSEPQAALTVNPSEIEPGQEIALSGAESSDKYGEIVAYDWSVADQQLDGETTTLSIEDPGEYEVELTVTNDAGETDTVSKTFSVQAAQETAAPETEDPGEEPVEEPAGIGLEQVLGVIAVVAILLLAVTLVRRKR
jgi:PGF-pre-PGF domain-containing protein